MMIVMRMEVTMMIKTRMMVMKCRSSSMIQSLTQMAREGVGKENLRRKGVTISFFGFINKSVSNRTVSSWASLFQNDDENVELKASELGRY
jgi:hypothetical protein